MKEDILTIPDLLYFDNSWDNLQKFLKSRGNPPWKCRSDLGLSFANIKTLGTLVAVGGYLDLYKSTIKSLGNLKSIGGGLDLYGTPIDSFGNLIEVSGYLDIRGTPLSEKYTKNEIKQIINVKGYIYM